MRGAILRGLWAAAYTIEERRHRAANQKKFFIQAACRVALALLRSVS